MNTVSETILAKGLQDGFAGSATSKDIPRGSFVVHTTDASYEGNAAYVDQWIGNRLAGGQELAKSGEELSTRVYAGGMVQSEVLSKLGINDSQVIDYLKKKLSVLAPTTRLHADVIEPADGDWQYAYQILKDYPDLPLTVGVETISYKNTDVFVHVFLNTPIA